VDEFGLPIAVSHEIGCRPEHFAFPNLWQWFVIFPIVAIIQSSSEIDVRGPILLQLLPKIGATATAMRRRVAQRPNPNRRSCPGKIKDYFVDHRDEFFRNRQIDLKQMVLITNNNYHNKLSALQSERANGADFHKVEGKYGDNMGF
jgi:hypothetical protein